MGAGTRQEETAGPRELLHLSTARRSAESAQPLGTVRDLCVIAGFPTQPRLSGVSTFHPLIPGPALPSAGPPSSPSFCHVSARRGVRSRRGGPGGPRALELWFRPGQASQRAQAETQRGLYNCAQLRGSEEEEPAPRPHRQGRICRGLMQLPLWNSASEMKETDQRSRVSTFFQVPNPLLARSGKGSWDGSGERREVRTTAGAMRPRPSASWSANWDPQTHAAKRCESRAGAGRQGTGRLVSAQGRQSWQGGKEAALA